jgi:hypothetical protein
MLPNVHSAGIHSLSAASAGAIATMTTHPFDVIKVCNCCSLVLHTPLIKYADESSSAIRIPISRPFENGTDNLECAFYISFPIYPCDLISPSNEALEDSLMVLA